MSTLYDDLQDDARAMAERWGLDTPGPTSALATNNGVWRCGDVYLKAFVSDLSRRKHEIALLNRLIVAGFGLVPNILPTKDGSPSIERNGVLWTAESRLKGRHPNADSIDDYSRIGHGIVILHAAMSKIKLENIADGCVADLHRSLLYSPPSTNSLPAVTRKAAALLRDALPWIEAWPRTMTHGDLTHPNIIITDNGSCGFLDFEFTSNNSYAFDVAAVATTLFVRSTLDGVARREAWHGLLAASDRFCESQIIIATLARRWISFVWNLRQPNSSADVYRKHIRHLDTLVPMATATLASDGW